MMWPCESCRVETEALYLDDNALCPDCAEERERDRLARQADRASDAAQEQGLFGDAA